MGELFPTYRRISSEGCWGRHWEVNRVTGAAVALVEGPSNPFHRRPGVKSGMVIYAEILVILEKPKGKKGLGQRDSLVISSGVTRLWCTCSFLRRPACYLFKVAKNQGYLAQQPVHLFIAFSSFSSPSISYQKPGSLQQLEQTIMSNCKVSSSPCVWSA